MSESEIEKTEEPQAADDVALEEVADTVGEDHAAQESSQAEPAPIAEAEEATPLSDTGDEGDAAAPPQEVEAAVELDPEAPSQAKDPSGDDAPLEGEEVDPESADAGDGEAVASSEAVEDVDAAEAEIEEPGVESDEAEAEPAAEEPDDGRLWYVVHCYSGYENKVRHNLEQRIETMGMKGKIFDIVVPTEEEIEIKDGKRRTVERRVFPGYILVQMIMDEDSWYVVRNTPGVTGFVGMGNEPTPLRPEEVSSIVRRMEAEAPRIKVTYKTGQKVRIIDGPFNDFIGTVADIDMERAKVRVMVSFFGRETPVELDFLQVEKA